MSTANVIPNRPNTLSFRRTASRGSIRTALIAAGVSLGVLTGCGASGGTDYDSPEESAEAADSIGTATEALVTTAVSPIPDSPTDAALIASWGQDLLTFGKLMESFRSKTTIAKTDYEKAELLAQRIATNAPKARRLMGDMMTRLTNDKSLPAAQKYLDTLMAEGNLDPKVGSMIKASGGLSAVLTEGLAQLATVDQDVLRDLKAISSKVAFFHFELIKEAHARTDASYAGCAGLATVGIFATLAHPVAGGAVLIAVLAMGCTTAL